VNKGGKGSFVRNQFATETVQENPTDFATLENAIASLDIQETSARLGRVKNHVIITEYVWTGCACVVSGIQEKLVTKKRVLKE